MMIMYVSEFRSHNHHHPRAPFVLLSSISFIGVGVAEAMFGLSLISLRHYIDVYIYTCTTCIPVCLCMFDYWQCTYLSWEEFYDFSVAQVSCLSLVARMDGTHSIYDFWWHRKRISWRLFKWFAYKLTNYSANLGNFYYLLLELELLYEITRNFSARRKWKMLKCCQHFSAFGPMKSTNSNSEKIY